MDGQRFIEKAPILVQTVNQIDLACFGIGADLKITFASNGAAALFERPVEDLVGLSFLDLAPKAQADELANRIAPVLNSRDGESVQFEGLMQRRPDDGDEKTAFPCEIRAAPVSGAGEAQAVIYISDLGEMVAMREDLLSKASTLELLNRVLEASNKNIYLKDVMGVSLREICRFADWPLGVVFLPSSNENEFALSSVQYCGDQSDVDISIDFDRLDERFGLIHRLSQVSSTYWFNGVELSDLIRADGWEDHGDLASMMAVSVDQEDGAAMAIMIFLSEDPIRPTDDFLRAIANIRVELGRFLSRRRDQLRLLNAKLKAEAAAKSKSAFLANMNHELRTPLNAIIGYSELMLYDPGDPVTSAQGEKLEYVVKAARHLNDIINNVLELAYFENNGAKLEVESVDVKCVIDELVDLVQPLAAKQRVTIIMAPSVDEIPLLRANSRGVTQTLLNILSNAIKYNREDGTVTVSAGPAANGLHRISIADTGQGIDEQNREAVFEPFNRLHQESSEIEGTGIGLSISKNIMEQMGGGLEFDSELGTGTVFHIDLPVLATGHD